MKIIRDTQQAETSKKRQEFENLNVKLLDLQPLISRNSTVSYTQNCSDSLLQR